MKEVRGSEAAAWDRLRGTPLSREWSIASAPEPKVHQIHPYPAKFPAFLATKAFELAREEGVKVERAADVFCGCGTAAYEARREGVRFWGCDINPVATLIARAKSTSYDADRFEDYAQIVVRGMRRAKADISINAVARTRLQYWYPDAQLDDLSRLLNSIRAAIPSESKYRTAFYCAFSAILKATSLWQQRSVKPARDSRKLPIAPRQAFEKQCHKMAAAWRQSPPMSGPAASIQTGNMLNMRTPGANVDLILTSPPYVTSYEYADIHQLSSLWLGYADDYRTLRCDSIGSASTSTNLARIYKELNRVGHQVTFSLFSHDQAAARSVARYYADMQLAARRCYDFLKPHGMALFVIGNTEYRGIHIDNAAHLAEALFAAGFTRVRAIRRETSNKSHTPFRSAIGRFSRISTDKYIYAEEFILVANKR